MIYTQLVVVHTIKGLGIGFQHSSVGKEFACNTGDLGSLSGLGRFPEEENGNPLQYFCLENPIDRIPGRLLSMESQEPDTT